MTENISTRPNRRRRTRRPAARAVATPATTTPAKPAPAIPAAPAPAVPPVQHKATPATVRSFGALGVSPVLVELLESQGITAPFPIQAATLPDAIAGRDVLGRGQTGSGKTLAFSLPVVQRLTAADTRRQPRRPRALVLVPTRELANQVLATLEPLASSLGLRSAVVFGGVGQGPQAAALRAGIDVLVACPGRLEDLLAQNLCDLSAVEVSVLDEADHMADLGFLPAVRRILDQTPRRGQRLLFSATLDNGIDVLVSRYLSSPVHHSVDPAAAPVSTMSHHVFEVDTGHKSRVVQELAAGHGRSLLFTRTKHGAKKLAKQLTAAGVPAVDLHGNLAQKARERNLDAFSSGSVKVLVATDIAARGIHVDDVELVVHVDPPAEHKAYLHRSGRTARAGSAGVVVTLMTSAQRGDVRTLARQAGIQPVYAVVSPGATEITNLTGPAADFVPPTPVTPSPTTPQRRSSGARTPVAASSHRSSAASVSAGFAGSRRRPSSGRRSRLSG